MIKSQFHWLRSRACVTTAVEQHAIGATGLADILARYASEEGRQYRIAHKAEKMTDCATVGATAMIEYGRSVYNFNQLSRREQIAHADQIMAAYQASHPNRTEIISKVFGDKVLRK